MVPGLWGAGRSERARGGRNGALPVVGTHGAERGALGAIFGRLRESEVTFACSIVGELLCDIHGGLVRQKKVLVRSFSALTPPCNI